MNLHIYGWTLVALLAVIVVRSAIAEQVELRVGGSWVSVR